MYNYIKGKITEVTDSLLVIEAGGIGYELNIGANAAMRFSPSDSETKVYCKLIVREDEMSLYGFCSLQEKAMFDKLIGVSGVGPKLALVVLGGMTAEQFAAAVVKEDVAALSKIKGVGKKTAERIVLELRDKVNKDYVTDELPTSAAPRPKTAVNEEAVLALMTLGYTRQEATDAVARVQTDDMPLEKLIFAALKNA